MEKSTSRNSTIPQKNVKQQCEEEHDLYNHALNRTCAKFCLYRTNLQNFPLNGAIWNQSTSESVQRQVKISIDRRDAHNMQILQDWNTYRRSKITLLNHPAAKLINMRVRLFSDSTLCGVSNPDPSNNWATKLEDVWNEHGFVEKLTLAARDVRFIWHVLPCAPIVDTKEHFQNYLKGQSPKYFDDKIIFMSMFSDIAWTKKGNTEKSLHDAKEVAAFATKFKPKHWCILGPALDGKHVWTANSNELQGQWDIVGLQMADILKCHTSHPIRQPTEQLSLGQYGKRRSYHFHGTFETKMLLIMTILASNLLCVYNRNCQWYEIANQIPTPRTAEHEEQIDLEPEQLTLITHKQQTMTQAGGDSVLPTENHETRIRKPSEQAVFARTVENGQFYITNVSFYWRKQFYSCLQRILKTKKFPVTGIEVFRSAETLVIEVQVPSQQPRNKKYWVWVCRGLNNTHDNLFVQRPTTEILKSCHHSCQWAAGDREHKNQGQEPGGQSPVRYKAAPKPEQKTTGFSQRVRTLIPAKALTKRDCEFVRGCHEADGAVRWDHVLTNMPSAEQTPVSGLRSGWVQMVVLVEDQNGTILYIRAVQRHSHGVAINADLLSLKLIPLNRKEHMFHTGSCSNKKSISENGRWAGEVSLGSTRQVCFLSPLNPQDSSSRQRTSEWTVKVHEPRMVLHKQICRPDHDCIHCFNLRRAQDANLVFHQSSCDAIILYDTMPASALDKVVTFAREVIFERKPLTLTKPEATPGDRIYLPISGQPKEPHLLNDREVKSFLISSLMKQVLKSLNKSTMINELIRNHSQKNAVQVDH